MLDDVKLSTPSRDELEAARGRTIPAVLAPGLNVVFVGINPGLWSGATGHHFAHPRNRFWKTLHLSGFTPRELSPAEDAGLPQYRLGVTNLVERTTAKASELTRKELRAGGAALVENVQRIHPRSVAVLGIGAYRRVFDPKATLGQQEARIAGAETWMMPNPSPLNAQFSLDDLVALFTELRESLG
jgi:TDG/mug DNA glycosylase family protein